MIDKDFDKTKEISGEISFRCDNVDISETCEYISIPSVKTPNDIKKEMKDKACKVFSEMLVELCPELLGYGAAAVEWENEFRKRLEE